MKSIFYVLSILLCISTTVVAQVEEEEDDERVKKETKFKTVFDEPYNINKIWLQLHPVYADIFFTNANVGLGASLDYLHSDVFDLKVSFRTAYGRNFDFYRDVGEKNSNVDNDLGHYMYLEAGGAYHVYDEEHDGKAKIILYTRRLEPWEFGNSRYVEVPCLVRKVATARLGGYYWSSVFDVKAMMGFQDKQLRDQSGNLMPSNLNPFSNLSSTGIYIGGGYREIKNVAIKPKSKSGTSYGVLSNDMMFNAYADLLIAVAHNPEDVFYDDVVYGTDVFDLNSVGYRLGIDVLYNKEFFFAYGAEIGSRPSFSGRGTYIMGKVSFPVLSYNLMREVE